jgi:predicted small metal-binding protein
VVSLTDPFALACGRVRLPCQFLTDARNKQDLIRHF